MLHFRIIVYVLFGVGVISGCNNDDSTAATTPPVTNPNPANPDTTATDSGVYELAPVADSIVSPVAFAHAGDSSGRLFVVQQSGQVMVIKDGQVLPQPFLDVSAKLASIGDSYSEMGLLGLAFHPDYQTNGRFFVYYSAPARRGGVNHTSVIAEYKVSASNPDQADPAERVLLTIDQPESNHNGGQLAFGPDGYLYISSGDGGGAGDRHGTIGNGQNINNLLGKILRIDVNSGEPYSIPADNPLAGKDGADEIYAWGLRNPWRFSFDRQTGRLFCGDVGQNEIEEIDIIENGKNYGWRAFEGTSVYDANLQNAGTYTPPIHEYPHSVGISVTGGYVYRGKALPTLNGKYVFADWESKLFVLTESGATWERQNLSVDPQKGNETGLRINSFGEDEAGEIYVLTQSGNGPQSPTGAVYKIVTAN